MSTDNLNNDADYSNVSQSKVDSLLSEIGGSASSLLINENIATSTKESSKITSVQKIEDWDEIKNVFDQLNILNDEPFQSIRLKKLIKEVQNMMK